MNDIIVIVRFVNGIGIDKKLNGYTMDGKTVKKKVYGGCLCYQDGKKRVYYSQLKRSNPVNIVIDNSCPF